jgi:hypothetical protein
VKRGHRSDALLVVLRALEPLNNANARLDFGGQSACEAINNVIATLCK